MPSSERPRDAESAEANMIRDELRHAARAYGEAAGRVERAIDQAAAFIRTRDGAAAHRRPTVLRTPAAMTGPTATQNAPQPVVRLTEDR